MSTILLTEKLKNILHEKGIETLHGAGHVRLPLNVKLEAPGSLKWLKLEQLYEAGAFSYAVSGYMCAVKMGRYCSIGEEVQIGRQDHPTTWLSTSPFQYLNSPLFNVGNDFDGAENYQKYRSHLCGKVPATKLKITNIGNDVWIGHGAMVKAGVNIGDGSIIAANAMVTKDVPPYALVAGNPAVIKKYRFPKDIIESLLKLKWWDFAPWQLNDVDFSDINTAIKMLEVVRKTEQPYKTTKVFLKDFIES